MTSKILDIFYRNPHQFISTMLVGNNIALVVYGLQMAIILEPLIARVVNNEALIVLTQSIISTILILFTGEFIPKTVFKLNPNFSLTLFSVPLLIIYVVLYPVSKFSSLLSFLILKIAGVKNVTGSTQRALGKVDLDYFIQQSIEDAPQNSDMDTEVKIFQNALDFSNVRLRDCIVPRTEIVACDKTAALEELRSRFVETGLSKILVYNENIDDIVGYIHSSEMFKNPEDWTQSIRSVSIVPETMAANKLMKVLMQDKKSMAVVVDEFGAVSGLVTIEDILEQIVGDIEDEFDEEDVADIRQLSRHTYAVRALTDIDDFNAQFNTHFDDEEVDTIGGLIMQAFGYLPKRGEEITLENIQFKVTSADSRRLIQVRVTVPDEHLSDMEGVEEQAE